MKYFAVIIPFIVLVAAQDDFSKETLQTLMKYHTECKGDTGISDSTAAGSLLGNFPDDPALKQHLLCMSKKIGFQNEAGEIQTDVVKEKLNSIMKDQEKANQITEKCALQKDSPEDTAFDMAKCYYENAHHH